jgi:pyridoxal phosphate enzyme (YggS family)
MSICQNIELLRKKIPDNVKLVCVSKLHSTEEIIEAYNAGERIFGENKMQELLVKQQNLPENIEWHFIGHLQTNKVKYIVPFVSLIHGVDSLKLLKEIDKAASKNDKIVNCLVQIHIAEEDTKFGFSEDELIGVLEKAEMAELNNVNICGLMGMATFTSNQNQVRKEFRQLKTLFDKLKSTYFADNNHFKELSMGMSDDYQIAIEEGSTMVRIGTAIFGMRNYT